MFAFCVYTPHEFRIDWFLVYSLLTVQFSKSFLGCRFKRRLISYHSACPFVNTFFLWKERRNLWVCLREATSVILAHPFSFCKLFFAFFTFFIDFCSFLSFSSSLAALCFLIEWSNRCAQAAHRCRVLWLSADHRTFRSFWWKRYCQQSSPAWLWSARYA